jgi:hypothetical protein
MQKRFRDREEIFILFEKKNWLNQRNIEKESIQLIYIFMFGPFPFSVLFFWLTDMVLSYYANKANFRLYIFKPSSSSSPSSSSFNLIYNKLIII